MLRLQQARSRTSKPVARRSEIVKRKENRAHQADRRCGVVPSQVLAEVVGDKDAENDQRDHFLDDLELDGAETSGADAVGGHLEAVLEEGDRPTDENHLPERLVPESEVPVPGKRHEDVGEDEENDGPHLYLDAQSKLQVGKASLTQQ